MPKVISAKSMLAGTWFVKFSIEMHSNASDHSQTHPNVPECVQTRPKTSKHLRKCLKMNQNHKTIRKQLKFSKNPKTSKCVRTHANVFEHVRKCTKTSTSSRNLRENFAKTSRKWCVKTTNFVSAAAPCGRLNHNPRLVPQCPLCVWQRSD